MDRWTPPVMGKKPSFTLFGVGLQACVRQLPFLEVSRRWTDLEFVAWTLLPSEYVGISFMFLAVRTLLAAFEPFLFLLKTCQAILN